MDMHGCQNGNKRIGGIMKKHLKALSAALAAIIGVTGLSMAASTVIGGVSKVNYQFRINEKSITLPSDQLILSRNNTTYVPLRFLSEAMGAQVDFNQGVISISGIAGSSSNTASGTITQSEKEKLDSALRELELIKKENVKLQNQLTELEKKYDSSGYYKRLPVAVEDTYGLNIRLDSVTRASNDRAVFNITLTNKDKDNSFVVLPEKTILTVGSQVYDSSVSTAALSSSLVPYTSSVGLSGITGDLEFGNGIYVKDLKGALTFYYRVNNGADIRSMTIYFDITK